MDRLRSSIQWLLVGACEVPIVINLLVSVRFPWLAVLATHTLATLLAYFSPPRTAYHRNVYYLSRPWAVWLAVWVLFLPGMGWIFGTILLAGSRWGDVQTFEEDADAVLPAAKLPREMVSDDPTARVVNDLDFLPLVDVMAGTDVDLKRSAIEQLARLRTPDSIRVLLQHRRDPQLEIRFYVNAALSRIKKEFDEEVRAARHQMEKDIYKVSARIFLATVYLRYTESGLLDADMVNVYEEEAMFHLTFALESDHPTPEVFRLLVGFYATRGKWEESLEVVEKSRQLGIGYDAEMQQQHVRILYHMKCYANVPTALGELKALGDLSSEWQTAALWWGVT